MRTGIFMLLKSFIVLSSTQNSNKKISKSNISENNPYGSKQSVLDDFTVNGNNNAFEDEVLMFNDVEDLSNLCNGSIKLDKDRQINNQNKSLSLENFDFLDHVDYIEMPEDLEKLNNFELPVLNPKEVEKILKHEETLGKMNISMTKDSDLSSLEKNTKNTCEEEKQDTEIILSKTDLEMRHDILTKKYMGKMKSNFIKFMKKTIPDYYVDFYIKRLTALERAFVGISFFDFEHYDTLPSRDCELVNVLKQLHSNFGNEKEFNHETYQDFNYKFNSLQFKDTNSFYCVPTVNQSKNYEIYYFYFELMKLYRYIYEIPELLTVADIYIDNVFCGITFILHLIYLFAEKIGSLKDNRVFILCLINKAFSYSYKHRINFFSFTKYKINCPKDHSNIDFLFWEIHFSKRACMKKRIKRNEVRMCSRTDYDHLKAVVVIYLYQHFEFLVFYNFKDKEINNFCAFIYKALLSNDCFACLFDEYLEVVKRQTISLK